MSKRSIHVVPAPKGGWVVRKTGAERASKHFDKKAEAIDWGKGVSKSKSSELVIHRRDGTIQQKEVFRRDPKPSRDKK